MSDNTRLCSGFVTTGYNKGYPCAAISKYHKNGKLWCKNHLPVDEDSKQDCSLKDRIKKLKATAEYKKKYINTLEAKNKLLQKQIERLEIKVKSLEFDLKPWVKGD